MIQIAIVEDEEIYVKQLTEYIRKYQTERGRSIKVTVFGDGEDITENYSGGFDIILMDIQMRFMDGMTAAEKIRQMDQKVIIMFITINEQISNFAQTYPTNLKASSNEALLFMRRYRFANCSCFSCCFKDAYPSSNVQ